MHLVRARARRLVGGLAALVLVTGAVTGLGTSAASASTKVSAGSMVDDVNKERRARGLAPYRTNGELASVALAQARRMAAKSSLHHNPDLRSDVKGYRWVGENVGYGPSLSVIQDAFMGSPGHRANVLDTKFTQVGVAAVRAGGRLWVAQVFRQPSASSSSGTGTSGSSADAAAKPAAKKRERAKKDSSTSSRPRRSTSTAAKPAPQRSGSPRASARPSSPAPSRSVPAPSAPSAPTPPSAVPSAPAPPSATPTRTPSSAPTLVELVQTASAAARPAPDPVADALAFAAAMHTVGG